MNILAPNGKPIRSNKPKNQYEGAGQGPRLKHWNAPGTGPKQRLRGNLATLRNRTRGAFRNDLLLRAAIMKNITAEIGKGITVQSDCDDIEFRQAANNLWQCIGSIAKRDSNLLILMCSQSMPKAPTLNYRTAILIF